MDYTFESKIDGTHSTVDHFILSGSLIDMVKRYDVVHSCDNTSDHDLVRCEIEIPAAIINACDSQNTQSQSKPLWKDASDKQLAAYRAILDLKLNAMNIPSDALSCRDLQCNDVTHRDLLNRYHDDIVSVCLKASEQCIPMSKSTHSKVKPGWNDLVKPHRDRAMLWHTIWKDNGSPRNGLIANIRRTTRARYHLAIREVNRNAADIRPSKMAAAFLSDNKRDFWAEVKKIRGSSKAMPCQIHDVCGNDNISQLFSDKYESVYNSASYDLSEMKNLLHHIENDINMHALNEPYVITSQEVLDRSN